MTVNMRSIRSAVTSPRNEASLTYEELGLLASCVLLSDQHGYFVDSEGYVKWLYRGLVEYIFSNMYMRGLIVGVDKVKLILDASVGAGFHEVKQRSTLVRLTPPSSANALIRDAGLFRARHESLRADLAKHPTHGVFPALRGRPTPTSVSEIVQFCVRLSPEERQVVKWMAQAHGSPIMELMTQFGYMAEERRRTITSLIPNHDRLATLNDDKTYRKFVQRYFSLTISEKERALLIFIGRSDYLADLGRRIVRLSRDRREMIARML